MAANKVTSRMAGWKIIILAVIALLFTVRIGYIAFRNEIDKEYYTSARYDLKNAVPVPCTDISQTFTAPSDRINSVELFFTDIPDGRAGAIVLRMCLDGSLIYQTDVSLENMENSEWKKVFVNAELRKDSEYEITLNANEACTRVPNVLVVKQDYAPEITASYSEGRRIDGNIAINYGYLRNPSRFDRCVMISLWILLYIIIYMAFLHIESILQSVRRLQLSLASLCKPQVIVLLAELAAALLIIHCSGIEFQSMTQVLMFGISVLSSLICTKKGNLVWRTADRKWKRVLLVLLYFYGSFSLVGQRLLIYPFTLKVTPEGLLIFLCTSLWFIPVVNTLIILLNHLSMHLGPSKIRNRKLTGIIILCLLVPAVYNLIANNPGISSPDTLDSMITNAQHLHGMYNWHPAFYCMVLRVIESVSNSTYAVILVQYFFWAYVMTELLLYVRKKGIGDSIVVTVALLSGMNAGNFVQLNTIWKDIPYTLSLLWAFVLTAKLTIDYEEYRKKWYIYLELIVSLVGVFFYRKNGMISYAVISLVLLIVLIRNRKAVVSLLLSVILIWTVKGPVYSYYQVEDPGYRGIYHGLGQDILGVYYSGGEVSENTLKMINMMTEYNNAEYSYITTWSNQSYDVPVTPMEFIADYLDTFIRNPVIMTRAIINREDALWDIFAGQDTFLGCVNYTGTQDWAGEWSEYYPLREYTSLKPRMSSATAYTADAQWLNAIEWRSGLFTLLGLMATVLLILKKGKGRYLAILAPSAGHILSLLLSTGWSDFRYFWPMNLLNLSILLLTVVLLKNREQNLLPEAGGEEVHEV